MRLPKALFVTLALALSAGCEFLVTFETVPDSTTSTGATGGAGAGGSTGGNSTGGNHTGGKTGGGGAAGCDVASCPAPSSECKVAYCDASNACAEKNADDGTVAATQITGDCKKTVCMGGAVTSANDDADIEVDSTDCTTDTCENGSPVHTPAAADTACSDNGGAFCDDAGTCVECNIDAQCAAPTTLCDATNVCVLPHCQNNTKDFDETDKDCGGADCGKCADDLGCATAGDCLSNNCLGMLCVAGTCNDGILNNNQLGETDKDCGGGTCPDCGFNKTCSVNTDCKSGDCTAMKCAANCTDMEKNQDETDVDCGGALCGKCINTKACLVAGDCTSGFCNANVCSACANDLQCAGNQYCLAGVCVPDKPTGSACSGGTQCVTNNCVDGVCCGAAACGTCQACNIAGNEGVCSNVGPGTNDDTCAVAQNKQCDGLGGCKSVNGQVCAMGTTCLSANCVDGVCCAQACAGICKACNVAGSVGSCVNVPAAQDDNFPANACVGISSCDGAGNCKKDNGQVCAAAADCVSGNCVDGVCCGSASCGTCQSCGIAGSFGICTNIPAGQTDNNPANTCVGTQACNGAGVCKAAVGQLCPSGNVNCANGQCVDGYCCATTCAGTCKQCNLPGSLGICSNSLAGADPANECSIPANGFADCNGAGTCGLGASGTACVPLAVGVCVGPVDCPAGGVCP